jgi:outer membrane protein OmpA-like peptidoglycan-associated protein
VNTPGSEESPFIAKDDLTLYFSSDGHLGMGGNDLFMTRKQLNGKWSKAENLGYPVNSFKDERCLAVAADGINAYIATERPGGFGGLDIWAFELHEKIRPLKTGYVKGIVYDARTLQKIRAQLELIDLETEKPIIIAASNKLTGQFLFCLPGNKNYALNVSCDGYLFHSENFSLKNQPSTEPITLDIPLKKILEGERVVLKNIFFDTDKFDLKPESKSELNKLIGFLNNNPSMKIEIGGHTDNTGAKEKNTTLSEIRAKAVYDYLVLNGIQAARLSFKGYAETLPVADNKTEAGRKQNRRTEFKILGK